jgi:hypothetical protein
MLSHKLKITIISPTFKLLIMILIRKKKRKKEEERIQLKPILNHAASYSSLNIAGCINGVILQMR